MVPTPKGWWAAANADGVEGKVPSNFLKLLAAPADAAEAPTEAAAAAPTPSPRRASVAAPTGSAPRRSASGSSAGAGGSRKAQALGWCRELCAGTQVQVDNFGSSFADGLAFVAIMAGLLPDKVQLAGCEDNTRRENYTLAFWIALEVCLPPLPLPFRLLSPPSLRRW